MIFFFGTGCGREPGVVIVWSVDNKDPGTSAIAEGCRSE